MVFYLGDVKFSLCSLVLLPKILYLLVLLLKMSLVFNECQGSFETVFFVFDLINND